MTDNDDPQSLQVSDLPQSGATDSDWEDHRLFAFCVQPLLSEWDKTYKETGKGLNYNACSAKLTLLKKEEETIWLKEVDSIALQSSLRNLSDSYDRFFKKQNSYPSYKSKKNPVQSYTTKHTNGNIAIVGTLKLPKWGWSNSPRVGNPKGVS